MNTQAKYCGECGVSLPEGAIFCGECGTPIIKFSTPNQTKPRLHREKPSPPLRGFTNENSIPSHAGGKSKITAILLGVFLGGFGAHKFYMGSWGWGIVYLLTSWLFIPFIIALVEWIRYLFMTGDKFNRKAAAFKDKGAFGFFW
jgi:TM2 domain-containing membrane protein YozV